MRLSIKTCTLDMPFEAMLDFCVAQGVQAVEIGTGNWSGAPHIDLDELLGSETARQRWMDQLRRRDIALCALNCSGNPLAFQKDWEVTEKTFRLAKLLGVEKIVMMSGLPAGCPGDKTPVWITTSWPPETQDILDYQWNEVAIPKWKELVRMAEDCGIRQIALENHGMQLVYNPETLFRLREAVGPMVGMNLDPSHLFWMGATPSRPPGCWGSRALSTMSTARIPARSGGWPGQTAFWTRSPSNSSARVRGITWLWAVATTPSGGRSFSPPCGWRATTATYLWKWRT